MEAELHKKLFGKDLNNDNRTNLSFLFIIKELTI